MKFEVNVLNLLRSAPSYWYLATPYSDYPDGHDAAWEAACRIRGELMQYGVCCYSPIAETHAIAKLCGIGTDHKTWRQDNLPKMLAASGLIVARLPSWNCSKGIADEINYFETAGDPIVYLDP